MKKLQNNHSKTQLIVEKANDDLFGRISIKGNLIVDSASTLEALKKKMKKLAKDFESVEIDEFDITYDLTSFFEQHPYLSISEVAFEARISPGLMRQYSCGIKHPSEDRIKIIEIAIRDIGKRLAKIKLHKPEKEYA
jgi:hypothetical protein